MKTWAVLAPFTPAFADVHRLYLNAPTPQHPRRIIPCVLSAEGADWGRIGVYGSALHDVAKVVAGGIPGAQVIQVESPMWPADTDIANAFRASREEAPIAGRMS